MIVHEIRSRPDDGFRDVMKKKGKTRQIAAPIETIRLQEAN
jgi:hypothetical protein